MGGVTVTRATGDAHAGDSGPATKHYVDANIQITPNGTNEVGTAHTFTITVHALPDSTGTPTFGTITPSVSPAPTSQSDTCGSPTVVDATTRTCTLTINSSTAGTFTAN